MNTAIIGYGKMGKLIETMVLEKGDSVSAVIDPFVPESKTIHGSLILKSIRDLSELKQKPDIAVEFTLPGTAADNLLYLAGEKIPAVTGTTGWYERLPELDAAVKKSGTSLFWAPNFSLGMNLFYRLAEYAAEIFDPFPEYDAGGMETHHNKKADSPSGTAKLIAEKVLAKMTRKNIAVYDRLDHPPAKEELHFASLRIGSVMGIHSLFFDSPAETIEITHTMRNREALAAGAIRAAQWLAAKKQAGVYTMDDMLIDILQRSK